MRYYTTRVRTMYERTVEMLSQHMDLLLTTSLAITYPIQERQSAIYMLHAGAVQLSANF